MVNKFINNKTKENFRAQNIYVQAFDINEKKWLSYSYDGIIWSNPLKFIFLVIIYQRQVLLMQYQQIITD